MLPILSTLALVAAPQAVEPIGVLQQLDVPPASASVEGSIVTIPIELDGAVTNLVLEPYSVRAADFKVFATRPDGATVEMPAPAPQTWRGYIEGRRDSIVTGAITDDGLSAIAADNSTGTEWQIQPAAGFPAGVYSVALASEIVVPDGICGVPNTPTTQTVPTTPPIANLGTGLQLCELACDADFEFFQRNGNSVTATVNDIENIVNRMDTIYVRDVDVTFQLTAIVVRSNSNDPYTTSVAGDLLGQFAGHWASNFVGVRRDIAHLFTGKNLAGGTIGVAFLGQVCTNSGYGLSESRFTGNLNARTALTAHEIGHNFNAGHCDGLGQCRIMCSGLGGCSGNITSFGPTSINAIAPYAVNRPCLLDLAPPLAIPFFDDFESLSTLNRDIWITLQGSQVNTDGVNEPSGTQSVELNARNASAERDDFIITNKILLGSATMATLNFAAQHRGVPNGGALVVEIYNDSRDWVELARLVSNGVDETTYTAVSEMIPSSGLHDEAQIRFRTEVNGDTESWYIDDVEVTDGSCGGTQTYCVAGANSVSASGATVLPFGSTSIAANDLGILATAMPASSFAIWLYAENRVQNPLGDGFLCVNGSQIFRLAVVQSDFFGENVLNVDQNNLAPGSVINAGDTFNFQAWYRDSVGAGFNLTNALEVTFCP